MSSLGYLFFTQLKNQLKQLIHRPSQLIATILVVVLLGFMLLTGQSTPVNLEELLPPSYLSAMVLGFYTLMFFLVAHNGLSSGASFYTMADVSLLFSSPISTRRVLFYGLVKQLGTSVLLGFFLIFQYSWMHNLFGLTLPGLLIILLGYALTIFCAQLTSMAIYSLTAGDDGKQSFAKKVYWGCIAWSLLAIAVPFFLSTGSWMERLVNAANSPLSLLIPIGGWIGNAVNAALGQNILVAGGGFVLAVMFIAAVILLITRTDSDFYEDVLQATEVAHSAITAKKEGKMQDVVPKNVKVGKTGLGHGKGADAFYYKHKLENRRARIFLFDGMGLIMGICLLFLSFLMRDAGVAAIFALATYLQFFSMMTGRWIKELILPYVYLVPQPAFRKLLAICREQIRSICAEAVVLMIVVGVIIEASPLVIVAMIAARIGYGVLYMAGNILAERILGGLTNKIITFTLYFVILLLVAAPGILLGSVAGIFIGTAVGLLVTLLWNLLASAIIGFACKDILNCAELNNR